jgi:hypothetical protein
MLTDHVMRFRAGRTVYLLALIVLLGLGCSSRYRLNMYRVEGEVRRGIDVEETTFAINTKLNDPYGVPKVITGDRSTVVISVSWRGETISGGERFGLGFDRYIRYRIYMEMPMLPKPATIDLRGNSFVRLMQFYEIPPDDKIFLPVSGQFIIDSVKSDDVYATFRDGRWENKQGLAVRFEGSLKFPVQ